MEALIEPTEDEKRNGWNAVTLTAYVHERDIEQRLKMDPHHESRAMRPRAQNHKYNPKRWRG